MSLLTDEQRQAYREPVREFINKYAIHRVPMDQPPMLGKQPGTFYRWQFYMARATLMRDINIAISHLALDAIHDLYMERPFQLAGLDTDGIAIALGMLMVSGMYPDFKDLHMIRVRKERKEYGLQNLVEGIPKKDVPLLIVDDLLSSKITAFNAYYELRDVEGFEVLNTAFGVIHKVSHRKKDSVEAYFDEETDPLKIISLFNLSDFTTWLHSYDSD